jgi:hypothetical protein
LVEEGLAAAVLCLGLVACDNRPAVVGDLQPAVDRGVPGVDRGVPAIDRPRIAPDCNCVDSPRLPDGAPDRTTPSADGGGICGAVCKTDEAYLLNACVATDKLFTCAKRCDPSVPSSCPAGYLCDQWGGPPCCVCSSVVPACVPQPTTGKIVGPLRINPTSGIAGQKVKLNIQGAPFYVGALFYNVRIGSQIIMEEPTGKTCSIGATFTPPNPGVYVVEVSQYGGGGTPWVLAGFYTASGGVIPQPTIQPGDFCKTNPAPGDPACASASPYKCACVSGRCVCQ